LKVFNFKRKARNDGLPPKSHSPHSTPQGVLLPNQESIAESLPPLSQVTTSASSSIRKSSETEPGPLGLNVIYTPERGHKADIIFIHGLGGNSRWTWSKQGKSELFWPLKFLPLEPDICLARILSFGYDADIFGGRNIRSILDFAKALLFDLKYAKDDQKEDLNMGDVSEVQILPLDVMLTTVRGASSFCRPQHGGTYCQGGEMLTC
jgi:hypothetical protein